MKVGISVGTGIGALLLTSGCSGVPQLYRPFPGKDAHIALAPKVNDIVRQIACELRNASLTHLNGRNYLVTALLNLQVDDTLHVTPSLSFINPLAAAKNSTILEALDVGGERRRTFTTTLYLETNELIKIRQHGELGTSITSNPTCNDKALYSLSGDIGLTDIVRDGVGSYLVRYGDFEPHADAGANKPLFGSTVQFAVNRTVTALGPIWTLKRFKGPGGSAGLLNGKQLGTDTLTITFALIENNKEAVEVALNNVKNQQKLRDQLAQRYQSLAVRNLTTQQRLAKFVKLLQRQLSLSPNAQKSTGAMLQAQNEIEKGRVAQQEVENARAELDRANRELEKAKDDAERTAEQSQRSVRDATAAGQTLLNNMILQNLSVSPR